MFLEIGIGLVISYLSLFLLSILLKDNSIVDIFWGIGFIQVSLHSLYFSENVSLFHFILLGFVLFWALRLSLHIFHRRIYKGEEDPRYQEFRNNWNYFYLRSLLQVYILQGFLLYIISIPLQFFFSTTYFQNSVWFYLGITIAIGGLVIESIADWQFKNFLKNKQMGEIMNKGLWKFTRHPNYFGESTIWLGITIISLPLSYLSIISYLTIFVLLRFISGVPMAEKNLMKNPQYQNYMKKTPAFFPRIPKNNK